MTLGAELKAIREKKGYTLKYLSELTGLSIGFISQVERGLTDPSLSSLKKIASSLDVKLKDLFDKENAVHTYVPKGSGTILVIDSKVYCELLATSKNKIMEPTLKHISPGGTSGLVEPHSGEEIIYILSGELEVTIGDSTYTLHEGDCVYYEANQPHSWTNSSTEACQALWVMTPPGYS